MESNIRPERKGINNFKKTDLVTLPVGKPLPNAPINSVRQNELGVHTDVFIVDAQVGDRLIRPLREPQSKK